jgi:hypothetical protein
MKSVPILFTFAPPQAVAAAQSPIDTLSVENPA